MLPVDDKILENFSLFLVSFTSSSRPTWFDWSWTAGVISQEKPVSACPQKYFYLSDGWLGLILQDILHNPYINLYLACLFGLFCRNPIWCLIVFNVSFTERIQQDSKQSSFSCWKNWSIVAQHQIGWFSSVHDSLLDYQKTISRVSWSVSWTLCQIKQHCQPYLRITFHENAMTVPDDLVRTFIQRMHRIFNQS